MENLITVFNEFSGRLAQFGTVVAAGGAVRDSLMGREPKDYDIFVLPGHDGFDFDKLAKDIEPSLSDLEQVKPLEWHNSEPYLIATVRWNGFEVQVLVNPEPDMASLVSTFDWNVCLFAYDGAVFFQGEQIENIGYGKDLTLQKVTFPLSTLRRGFRFSERFKMKLKYDDIIDLCRRVVTNADKNAHKGPAGNEPDMEALSANMIVDNDIEW